MRQVCLIICVLLVISATGCRPAVTPGDAPGPSPTPTDLVPVVGTTLPGDAGSLPVSPVDKTVTPAPASTPEPTTELVPTGTSGIYLKATIGPTCPGPERPGQVCTQSYVGTFAVTNQRGVEVAEVTTDENGQALIDLPPGEYTVTPKIEGKFPTGAPVTVTVTDGQYVEVNIELDSGMR